MNGVMNHHPKISDHDLAHDHELQNEGTISTLLLVAGKASSKEKKSCVSDLLFGHLTKSQKEMQFGMTQNNTAL